jgi:hypothetical protein
MLFFSQIAYELEFKYPLHFTRLFKQKSTTVLTVRLGSVKLPPVL